MKGGGGNELFGGGSDGKTHTLTIGNGLNGALVKEMDVVGDTGGWDISTDDNCSNDTRINLIQFNQIQVKFGN